jgi:ribose transport system permease protein
MFRRLSRLLSQLGPLLGLIAVFALFCILCGMRGAPFHSFYNLKTIVTQTVIVGIGALGMALIMISGAIDLSVGSLIALTTVVVALVLRLTPAGQTPGFALPLAAALAGIAAAALCGCISGFITSRLRIVSFITTLGMMQIARGVAKWLGKEQTVVAPENWLNDLMTVDPSPAWLVFAPAVWLMLALLLVTHVLLRYTVFGRYVYAIGSNAATARLCGVRVENWRMAIFVVASAFTGIAGVMQFSNLTVGDPTAAAGMELDIIAAVVIGGGSLSGGEGSAVGTLVGALIMAVLRNGCNMLGVPNYVQNIIIGVVIIGAVGIDSLKHRLRAA